MAGLSLYYGFTAQGVDNAAHIGGLVSGFLLAVLCYRFTLLRDIITPVMVTLKIVPMISFVIMLLIWVGNQAVLPDRSAAHLYQHTGRP